MINLAPNEQIFADARPPLFDKEKISEVERIANATGKWSDACHRTAHNCPVG